MEEATLFVGLRPDALSMIGTSDVGVRMPLAGYPWSLGIFMEPTLDIL